MKKYLPGNIDQVSQHPDEGEDPLALLIEEPVEYEQTIDQIEYTTLVDQALSLKPTVLRIERLNSNENHLIGRHSGDEARPIEAKYPNDFDPMRWIQVDQPRPPATIIRNMDDFSELNELKEFRDWISSRKESEWSVAIEDNSGRGIPWEMFHLDNYTYLGSVAIVFRLENSRKGDIEGLTAEECKGTSHALVIDKMTVEEAGYGALFFLKGIAETRLPSFFKKLAFREKNIAFAYFACHVWFEEEKGWLLGCQEGCQDKEKRLAYDILMGKRNLFPSKPLIFLNACSAGRIHVGDPNQVNPLKKWGFPYLFLKKGARGVIAPLAMVENKYAARVAGTFLKRLKDTGKTAAEILRDLRHEIAERRADDLSMSRDIEMEFLHTFIYAYYGNPLIQITLDNWREDS